MLIVWQRALSGKNSFDGSVDIRWDQVRVSVDHSSNEKVPRIANFLLVFHFREIKEVRRGKQSKDFDSRVEEVNIFEFET